MRAWSTWSGSAREAISTRLAHSKTDQSGRGAALEPGKPIMGIAAEALTAWLEASGVREGAIFRQVVRGKATEALSAQAIYRMVKQRAKMAGLKGEFGAHSLRSGFVTEAGNQLVPLGEVMQLTGHKNVATALRYYQTGAAGQSRAANLLGTGPTAGLAHRPDTEEADLALSEASSQY